LPPKKNRLRASVIKKRLGTSIFTDNIVYHEVIPSTNTLAKELAAHGAAEGTLVLADEQTRGRGRSDKVWLSPAGTNLSFSIVLRPHVRVSQTFVFTMGLALAASDAVKKTTGLRPLIKWPNDLYVEGKKMAGILTEFSVRKKEVESVILGLGLNINWSPREDESMHYPATSVFAETGKKASRMELLVEILKSYEKDYRKVLAGRIDGIYKRWNELSMIKGKEVTVDLGHKTVRGTATDIDEEGALVIIKSDGRVEKIQNGEVSIRF